MEYLLKELGIIQQVVIQLLSSRPPSPLVFLRISTHFTATHGIPPASPTLKKNSFKCRLWVEPIVFTSDLHSRLHALYTQ